VRAISVGFGNNVQMGIPMATAVFGEAGLGLHLMLVSVHALVLLSVTTTLVELDLAHDRARREGGGSLWSTLASTLRNTVVHPVVLPVLAGLVWNALGLGLPPLIDEVLQLLGSAVVPLCLVLIGLSLAYYGVQCQVRGALVIAAAKLLLVPGLVLVVAHWGFGLGGLTPKPHLVSYRERITIDSGRSGPTRSPSSRARCCRSRTGSRHGSARRPSSSC